MITFNDEIKKANNAYPEAVSQLRILLGQKEPEMTKIVERHLKEQKHVVSETDLAEAIKKGKLNNRIFTQWKADYTLLINNQLLPLLVTAIIQGSAELEKKHSSYLFNIQNINIQKCIKEHTEELIEQFCKEQRKAVEFLIKKATKSGASSKTLVIVILSAIGLNKKQTVANWNRFHSIFHRLVELNPTINQIEAEKKAIKAAEKYAKQQHYNRSKTIALTELVMAYHLGEYYSVKQAQSEGILGMRAN